MKRLTADFYEDNQDLDPSRKLEIKPKKMIKEKDTQMKDYKQSKAKKKRASKNQL